MNNESIIVTEGVTVSFGNFQALKGIDVKIKQGEIMIILGPSGSGKSTFIRTLNRLQPHDGEFSSRCCQMRCKISDWWKALG